MIDAVVVVAYLLFIVFVGVMVGKLSKTTSDFFFGGRRFAWWLVGMSCVATLVGSYSFIQYSEVGHKYGFSSLSPYMNDWFVLPLFLLGWLPIFYYKRLESVPEYFEHRFDKKTRVVVIVILLFYLTGYIGANLYTIGIAMKGIMNADPGLAAAIHFDVLDKIWDINGFLDWKLIIPAIVIAVLSAIYLHSGGQTSVIVTDLIQGVLLLLVGLSVVWMSIDAVGGFEALWKGLPPDHRYPLARFNEPSTFHAVGGFWGDAIVASFGFYMINQGVMMRFLSARSVADGRKAMIFVAIILMPLAAIAVGGAGWAGTLMVSEGRLAVEPRDIFIAVSRVVTQPGIYGLVVAAMVAALMSTLDTLITAVSAIFVNDIIKPMKPNRPDEFYLHSAKNVAVGVTILGLILIPFFDQFGSIYQGLSAVIAALLPPVVIVIVFGVTTRRFTAQSAFWTLIIGIGATLLSLVEPRVISPFAHGVDPGSGFTYMRSLYGLAISGITAIVTMLVFPRQESGEEAIEGLTAFGVYKAMAAFKGSEPSFKGTGIRKHLDIEIAGDLEGDCVRLPQAVIEALHAQEGDVIYISDARVWLGGLRSVHAKAGAQPASGDAVEMAQSLYDLGGFNRKAVTLQKLL